MSYTTGQILFMRVKVIDPIAPFEPKAAARLVVTPVGRDGKPTREAPGWYVVDEDDLVTPQSIRDAILGSKRE